MSDAAPFAHGPLTGVRVLDLTSVIMGPYATHILADMGADVIKVESPEGDSLRGHNPRRSPDMSAGFVNLNRNKRSIVLDLKTAEGKEALRRLIATAHVFVHAMRAEAIARLGFDYAGVSAIKPDIVYCAAYGFGAGGPYANKPAYDDVIQAGSGLAELCGRGHERPAYVPAVIYDKTTGQAIAYSILAGVVQQARGGGGCEIEVPMFENAIHFNLVEHVGGQLYVPPTAPMADNRITSPARRPFPTADGYACILPYSTRNWTDFFDFVGEVGVMDDPRFADIAGRVANIDELYGKVERASGRRTTAEWMAFCDAHSIPCMPVLKLDDTPNDPHVRAVGLFAEYDHPTEGRYRTPRRPVNISGAPFEIRRHAPRLGQDTAEVLAEVGLAPPAE